MTATITTSRDIVRCALQCRNTGRIPIDFGGRVSSISVDVYRDLRAHLRMPPDERPAYDHHYRRLGIADPAEDFLGRFRVDTRYVHYVPPVSVDTRPVENPDGSARFTDEWGVGLRRSPNTLYYDFDAAPLAGADIEDLERWPGPPVDDSRVREWERAVAAHRSGGFALATVFKGIFEQSWPLRGFEKLLMDTAMAPDFVKRLWDRVLAEQKRIYGHFFDVVGPALDIVLFTEDLCGQSQPLFSPNFYRNELKPRHRELVDFIRAKCPQAVVAIHSDGAVFPLIRDFIDIGVRALNPLQTTAAGMDAQTLVEGFGGTIALWGGVDTQHLLPFESPQAVEREIEAMARTFAATRGYIFASAHNVASGTPVENVLAVFRALDGVNRGAAV